MDEFEISRLQAAYGDAVTRRAWGELVELFVADCPITVDTRTATPVELTGPVALGEFVAGAIERFAFFELAILNAVATVTGDGVATGRMWTWELRQTHDGERTDAFGVYQDDYRRVGGRWRFARRRYSSIARGGAVLDVLGLP